MRVDVGICAFKRIQILETIDSVAAQELPQGASLRVIVAENDDAPNLRQAVKDHARARGLDLAYVHAPARNISIARNACLDAATGDVLIFIDDDEIAQPNWIANLISNWQTSRAGAVFGPVFADYPADAPAWMTANNFHSNIPSSNKGTVETGFSCNVLLDRGDARVRDTRFRLAFGRTGGEDVDFFFRLHRAGVAMSIADDAVVREAVAPKRMSFGWLLRRRYMTGAIYGTCVAPGSIAKRLAIMLRSLTKSGYCALRALLAVANADRRMFWIMRAGFHAGVVSGCVTPPSREVYGHSA